MRGPITIDYWYDFCQRVFGIKMKTDDTTWNMRYGGKNLQATNIIFTNGKEDPWRHASITEYRDGVITIDIQCDGCSHCIDLHAPLETDPSQLKSA